MVRGQVLYTCWRCGAGNWIPSHWSWFTCWRDGALNYTYDRTTTAKTQRKRRICKESCASFLRKLQDF